MLIKTDDDFTNALGSSYNVTCWTLASKKITLNRHTDINYDILVEDLSGQNVFKNDTGIKFQIHFDCIQRFVALYFHNGTRGWYLGNEDVWDDINTPVAKLLSTKYELMDRVFTSAINGYRVEDVLSEENTKHYYNILTTSDPSKNAIHIVPKKHWDLHKDVSHVHQPDYKILEEKGVQFSATGIGTYDVSAFQNIDAFLNVRGFGKNPDFSYFSNSYDPTKVDDSLDAKVENEKEFSPDECYYTLKEENEKLIICISPKEYVDKNNGEHYGKFINITGIDLITDGYYVDGCWYATTMISRFDLETLMMAYGFLKKDDMVIK